MNIGNLIRRDTDASKQKPGMPKVKAASGNVLQPTDVLHSGSSPEAALQMMLQGETDVLPVYDAEQFNGFVFKNDLIAFVASQKQKLEEKSARLCRRASRYTRAACCVQADAGHRVRQYKGNHIPGIDRTHSYILQSQGERAAQSRVWPRAQSWRCNGGYIGTGNGNASYIQD